MQLTDVRLFDFWNVGVQAQFFRFFRAVQLRMLTRSRPEVPGIGYGKHNAWAEAFRDHGLREWLVSQRRGQSRLVSWFSVNWSYLWPRIIPLAILLGSLIVWRRARAQRKRLMKAGERKLDSQLKALDPWASQHKSGTPSAPPSSKPLIRTTD